MLQGGILVDEDRSARANSDVDKVEVEEESLASAGYSGSAWRWLIDRGI